MMSSSAGFPSVTIPHSRPAGVLIRLAAMAYEGILLFGVVFVAGYALLALAHWTYPLAGFQRAILQTVLFTAIGLYFVYQWMRTGQTLAMKSWHLRLVDSRGQQPRLTAALLRYVLAWHLWVPGLFWSAFFGGGGPIDLVMFGFGFTVLLIPASFDARSRLLHDRLSATRVIRER